MTVLSHHPITEVQNRLVTIVRADMALIALGAAQIFDGPPHHQKPPYIAIARHDLLAHDSDEVRANEHRLLLHVWVRDRSRTALMGIVEALLAAVLGADLSSIRLKVTYCGHLRTDTSIDPKSGQARAAVSFRLFSEAT